MLHKLKLEDKEWMEPIVLAEQTHSADFCFGNLFIWDDEYDQMVGEYEGRIVVAARASSAPVFPFPIGAGDVTPALRALQSYADKNGIPFVLVGVTKEHRALLEARFPGKFTFQAHEALFDYIYETEKLASLRGKKLHGKRNHINRFESLYPSWRFERLTPAHFDACRGLLSQWQTEQTDAPETVRAENDAIERAFRFFEPLGLEGGVLFAEGRLCAFTIGEVCAHDTYLVHFEKADARIEGAYSMINREFARFVQRAHPQAIYINREDDMGLESLRQSKHSYHPAFQVEKYAARWISEEKI